jgi:hypothetical protein
MEASYRVGWRGFAAAVLFAAGGVNALHGLAALTKESYYLAGSTITGGLHTWGVILLIVGALQILVAAGIFRGREWSVSAGIILALVSVMAQTVLLSVHPFGSVVVIGLDMLVIYALMVRFDW